MDSEQPQVDQQDLPPYQVVAEDAPQLAPPAPARTPVRRWVQLAVALVCLGLAVNLGWHAYSDSQTAAWVGEVTIPESSVTSVSRELALISPDANDVAADFDSVVVQIRIQAELCRRVMARQATVISDAQRQEVIATNEMFGTLHQNPVTREFLDSYADAVVLLNDQRNTTAYKDMMKSTPTRVNPRYGTWNQETGVLDRR